MPSEVDIGNRALDLLGAYRIVALTDDAPEAQRLRGMFDGVRDAELRSHPWKFAIQRVKLGALTEEPAYGFKRQFQLPADYLAMVEIAGSYVWQARTPEEADWLIEGRRILSDLQNPLELRYLRRVTEASFFDPLFAEALAAKLAWELTEALTQHRGKKQDCERKYAFEVGRAMRANALELPSRPLPEGSWISDRA